MICIIVTRARESLLHHGRDRIVMRSRPPARASGAVSASVTSNDVGRGLPPTLMEQQVPARAGARHVSRRAHRHDSRHVHTAWQEALAKQSSFAPAQSVALASRWVHLMQSTLGTGMLVSQSEAEQMP
jgi:hypothetical protein